MKTTAAARLLAALVTVLTSLALTVPASAGAAGELRDNKVHAAMTAKQFWRLYIICRGSTDPQQAARACHRRDRFVRLQGKRAAERFHRAWAHGDYRTVRRMVRDDAYIPVFDGWGARHPIDCTYQGDDGWYCSMLRRDGQWIGVRLDVTRYEPPRLPRWQVTGAAPDV